MKVKLHKLAIVIFTVILCNIYLQIVSCKSNEDPPITVYSNYTGFVNPRFTEPSIYCPVKYPYRTFIVSNYYEEYKVMALSDIEKLNKYAEGDYLFEKITIRATYSNNFEGKRIGAIDIYSNSVDKYLFDITIIGE